MSDTVMLAWIGVVGIAIGALATTIAAILAARTAAKVAAALAARNESGGPDGQSGRDEDA